MRSGRPLALGLCLVAGLLIQALTVVGSTLQASSRATDRALRIDRASGRPRSIDPGQGPPPGRGDLQINEIVSVGDENNSPWVELLNGADHDISLGLVSLSIGSAGSVPLVPVSVPA